MTQYFYDLKELELVLRNVKIDSVQLMQSRSEWIVQIETPDSSISLKHSREDGPRRFKSLESAYNAICKFSSFATNDFNVLIHGQHDDILEQQLELSV